MKDDCWRNWKGSMPAFCAREENKCALKYWLMYHKSVYFQLIFAIALVLVSLGACFVALFWRLASRFDARQCTAEWLDGFSLESYAPMERLLGSGDLEFLESQAGYRPEIGKRLMAERRGIFAAYLSRLVQDFNQLVKIGKLMIVYSPHDQQEFARSLWRQQVRFYAAVYSLRLQLALYPLGWTATDAHRLVEALTLMRDQIRMLASPQQFETA
jgi:hypothetical protein